MIEDLERRANRPASSRGLESTVLTLFAVAPSRSNILSSSDTIIRNMAGEGSIENHAGSFGGSGLDVLAPKWRCIHTS